MKVASFITAINFLILLFLIFRLGLPFVNELSSVLSSTDSIGVFLSVQANQFALMQVMLSILGIGIAIITFWGYFEIKRMAENKAEEAIKSMLPIAFNELLKRMDQEEIAQFVFHAKSVINQKSTDKLFQEGIRKMEQDSIVGEYEE